MSEEETPLVALEKDALDYKKEVEDNLKLYAKITLRSNNNDKAAYKNAGFSFQGLKEARTFHRSIWMSSYRFGKRA